MRGWESLDAAVWGSEDFTAGQVISQLNPLLLHPFFAAPNHPELIFNQNTQTTQLLQSPLSSAFLVCVSSWDFSSLLFLPWCCLSCCLSVSVIRSLLPKHRAIQMLIVKPNYASMCSTVCVGAEQISKAIVPSHTRLITPAICDSCTTIEAQHFNITTYKFYHLIRSSFWSVSLAFLSSFKASSSHSGRLAPNPESGISEKKQWSCRHGSELAQQF